MLTRSPLGTLSLEHVFLACEQVTNTEYNMKFSTTSISYASDSAKELQNVINTELKGLNDWLTTNKLSLNIVKTEFMVVGSRQRIKTLNNEIDIEINGNMVNQVTSVKSLGVHLDNHLMWSEHTDKLCKKIASAIGALKRIRSCISMNTAIQVYEALIQLSF